MLTLGFEAVWGVSKSVFPTHSSISEQYGKAM